MRVTAILFWALALACAYQGCDTVLTAGGWPLWWAIVGWRFAEQVLTSVGSALWKRKT